MELIYFRLQIATSQSLLFIRLHGSSLRSRAKPKTTGLGSDTYFLYIPSLISCVDHPELHLSRLCKYHSIVTTFYDTVGECISYGSANSYVDTFSTFLKRRDTIKHVNSKSHPLQLTFGTEVSISMITRMFHCQPLHCSSLISSRLITKNFII